MSPLSDTTNLAPAMAGADLFDHIRHMLYTTGPSFIISAVLFGIIGMRYAGGELNTVAIDELLVGLQGAFNLSPILLLAPVLVIVIVVLKTPAIPGLFGGAVLGGLFGAMFQGAGMSDIIGAMHYGYASETGIAAIDSLLSRGGMDSMMWTVSLILCAMTFGGVMERTGMLQSIADQMLKLAKNTGSLVVATIFTAVAMNLIAGDQYLSIVIPGRMFKAAYDKRGLAPKNLSRVLEDSGTLTSAMIPWNTCGAYMITTLGIAPWTYIPYTFLNVLNPLVSIFYGFTGITMEKVEVQAQEA
jgi:NhaC family Na+:H+ antiporter